MWETDVESGLGTLVTLEGDYCEGTFDRGVFLVSILENSDFWLYFCFDFWLDVFEITQVYFLERKDGYIRWNKVRRRF